MARRVKRSPKQFPQKKTGTKLNRRILAVLGGLLVAAGVSVVIWYHPANKIVDIRIGDCLIKVEIADTPEVRAKGLSNRKSLKDGHGMLFVFPSSRKRSFWMKDTSIPLAIAFIAPDGTIRQIEQLKPFDLRSVASNSPAQYVLEVNPALFEENHITVGMSVDLSNGVGN